MKPNILGTMRNMKKDDEMFIPFSTGVRGNSLRCCACRIKEEEGRTITVHKDREKEGYLICRTV